MKKTTNTLIIDDHPLFRNGLKSILTKTNLFNSIREFGNGKEAIEFVLNHNDVDVVFMDIDMPIINGIETTKELLKINASIKIITITMFCEPKFIYQMYEAGSVAYLPKDAPIIELTKAVNMVLNNQEYFSPRVQNHLALAIKSYSSNFNKPKALDSALTKAQKQVLTLLCNQYSTEEIAEELHISIHTVNTHRKKILDRTNSRNLAGLVLYALENNLIKVL